MRINYEASSRCSKHDGPCHLIVSGETFFSGLDLGDELYVSEMYAPDGTGVGYRVVHVARFEPSGGRELHCQAIEEER